MNKQTHRTTYSEHRLLRFDGNEDQVRRESSEKQMQLTSADITKTEAEKRTAADGAQKIAKEALSAQQRRYANEERIAANRLGPDGRRLSAEEYHRRIILRQGQREIVEQHFARVHLGPSTGGPKKLIVIFQGNNERLTAENDLRRPLPNGEFLSRRGGEYTFDELVTFNDPDTDVIQIKAGEQDISLPAALGGRTPDPRVYTRVAWAHAYNLLNDAFSSQGAFANRQYATMNVFGFSYGGGLARDVIEHLLPARYEAGLHIPLTGHSVYLDAQEFHSTPPRAVVNRPGVETHTHIYQQQEWIIRGAPLRGPAYLTDSSIQLTELTNPVRPGNNQHLSAIRLDHREMNNAHLNRDLFNQHVVPALRRNLSPSSAYPSYHPGPPTR